MSKKVFTLLLLTVFVLAQFSTASAAAVAADGTVTAPAFMPAGATSTVDLDWTAAGMPGPTTYVDMYARVQGGAYTIVQCLPVAVIIGTSAGSGTFTFDFSAVGGADPADGDYWEFLLAFDDTASCTTLPANAAVADNFMASSYVDGHYLDGFGAILPDDGTITTDVVCNTFEYWAIASDSYGLATTEPYSGFGTWNAQTTGTFAPAPIGPESDMLKWQISLPATASGTWTISISPEDAAGNNGWTPVPYFFRFPAAIAPVELEDCTNFTDVAGHADEVYIRYLATLGLISGFADGTFGPDNTLTRAEASTLIEISNGYDSTTLPSGPSSAACTFSDVAATDWFAGWVWQACADGYMNGIGGGLFDPNNLLTRGQIVTIVNNVYNTGSTGGFLNNGSNVLWSEWTNMYREAPWTDVSVGAFYALPVQYAYGIGVAEGTSATTFSPDQAVTRGEFAQMLFRVLSIQFGNF